MTYEVSALDGSGQRVSKTEQTAISAHGWRDEYRDKRYEAVLVKKDGKIINDSELDLVPLLNRAVHAEEFSGEAADWAIQVGPSLLAGLDFRIALLQSMREPPGNPAFN